MEISYVKTNLLYLKGVYLKDFLSTDDIKYVVVDNPVSVVDPYNTIPKKFINVQSWPTTTNLKCWNCDLLFQCYPKFIPINPERAPEGYDVFGVLGNFHEWNCAVKYVKEKMPLEQQWDAIKLINLIAGKFTGKMHTRIQPSPEKTEMKQYCGEEGITSKQYFEKIDNLNFYYD